MTAQMADTLRFRGDEYSLIAVEREPLFAPQSLGLRVPNKTSSQGSAQAAWFVARRRREAG